MSWTNPRTWVAGEILTAALLNTHLRDNLLETAPAKVSAAGDWVTASGANALQRTAKGTTGAAVYQGASGPAFLAPAAGKFIRFNAAGDALEAAPVAIPAPPVIYPEGFSTSNSNSTTWPVANLAIYLPIIVTEEITAKALHWVMGGVRDGAGNYDIGLYDSDAEGKPANRLASLGSTTTPALNTIVAANITDQDLEPGLYFIAFTMSSTLDQTRHLGTFSTSNVAEVERLQRLGVFFEASALPLPSTATPVTTQPSGSVTVIPVVALLRRE